MELFILIFLERFLHTLGYRVHLLSVESQEGEATLESAARTKSETTGNGQSLNLLNGLAFVQKNQNGKILLLFCCILCVIVLVRRAKSVDDLIEKTLFLHLLSLLYILTHLYYNILLVRIFD